MKLTIRKEPETKYKDLECGDIFRYGIDYYMFTNQMKPGRPDTDEYLSVNLSNGEMWYCDRDVVVYPTAAELYVTGE